LGRAELTPEMVAALVCREYGWRYEDYEAQPSWFITTIIEMLQQEAEESNRKNKA
jgi:hypothetical protein